MAIFNFSYATLLLVLLNKSSCYASNNVRRGNSFEEDVQRKTMSAKCSDYGACSHLAGNCCKWLLKLRQLLVEVQSI